MCKACLRIGCEFGAILAAIAFAVSVQAAAPVITAGQIEADWLTQDSLRNAATSADAQKVTPQQDAIGACDGIKNGKWGFHTENESNPWWQIDLGEPVRLDRIILFNRTELAERNSRIIVLLSDDAGNFRQVYRHDGTTFYGHADGKPLTVGLEGAGARYVRLQLPVTSYFHLDEVEIYAVDRDDNIALGKSATQSSVSQWSVAHAVGAASKSYSTAKVVERGLLLVERFRQDGVDVSEQEQTLRDIDRRYGALADDAAEQTGRKLYIEARAIVRKMAMANPLLDFDTVLFVKRAPPAFPHMSDQYYGWWSRPGGGIYLLEGFKTETPSLRCLTEDLPPGSFLRPDISYDGEKVVFAYCRFYHETHAMQKADKTKLPEDVFYKIYEMNLDGSGCRKLTHGKYDDFDARYLPDGDIVFLSTRKGRSIQLSKAAATATMTADLPDSYVRCGGDNWRPVPVFTLHRIDGNGGNIRPISAFENFEWTPSVAADGRILYARWDYIDRFNGPFMSLWSANATGTNPQLVYGNFTTRPQCVFEARSVPNSQKLVFTAAAHHSNMGGSIVLLDRTKGTEYEQPLKRLTPEVCFPETEGWPEHYYANPYPLSEEFFLVAWSDKPLPPHSFVTTDETNPVAPLGIYLYDAFGNLELLHRDPEIASMYPMPVRQRSRPPAHPDTVDWDGSQEGVFLVQDVYRGLAGVERSAIKSLRIIGVPPKTQPHMNTPRLGVSAEDPGKFVLGTVPVETDGSAHFRVPSGIPVFFQALDSKGLAVQTMRTLTYVQPGQTLSCIGCHESRELAPPAGARPIAATREPSRIKPGPEGSWPLRFDRLVQPILDKHCIGCHSRDSGNEKALVFDLSAGKSYDNLLQFADKDLHNLVFEKDYSHPGRCPAANSKLLALLTGPEGHYDIRLDRDSFNRLATWMDTYAQRLGFFSEDQASQLRDLRRQWASLLIE
ncbi:MAG: discoidin domain-containing protein [Sedimentisphaerales bacterium]|nr:discoidin domain-containing protein [Sedimentisphaerales bacterium]